MQIKKGIAHLDLNEPQTLSSLKNINFHSSDFIIENFIVQKKIFEIARWTIIAIYYVLENETLNDFKSQNLINLNEIDKINISSLNRIAHYVPYQQDNSYFEGEHGFSVFNVNSSSLKEFSLNSVIKIIPQLFQGERILFEIINNESKTVYRLFLDDEKNIKLKLERKIYTLINLISWNLFDKYLNLSIEIDLQNKKLNCYINCENISSFLIQTNIDSLIIKDYHIGASHKKVDAISYFIKETIILSQVLSGKQRKEILKHYCCQTIK